jgi:DNA-binding IclR family transcriptional regulator
MVIQEPPGSKAPAIIRASEVLRALALGKPLTLAQLSERAHLSKSSMSDICSTLVNESFIVRAGDQTYRLGRRIAAIAERLTPVPHIVDAFVGASSQMPSLESHTVSINTLHGNEVLTLNVRMGSLPLPLTPRPGIRTPTMDCAAGSAIVSGIPAAVLRAELDKYQAHQGISPASRTRLESLHASLREHGTSTWRSPTGIQQLAHYVVTPHVESLTAITLHLPNDPQFRLDIAALAFDLTRMAELIAERARHSSAIGFATHHGK